jgi:pimeloyl-ACP methyl ester carboxylesterase
MAKIVYGARSSNRTGGRMMEIQVESWGEGPPVVLVHGVMGNGPSTWRSQRELAEDWTLIVPTRRGSVPNPPIVREDYDTDADDIVTLVGDGAHLVGHSVGGLVALLATARSPERVKSLCLIEPSTDALVKTDPPVAAHLSTIEALLLNEPNRSLRDLLVEPFALLGPRRSRSARPLARRDGATRSTADELPPLLGAGPPGSRSRRFPGEKGSHLWRARSRARGDLQHNRQGHRRGTTDTRRGWPPGPTSSRLQ